jgi:hypothetical protein
VAKEFFALPHELIRIVRLIRTFLQNPAGIWTAKKLNKKASLYEGHGFSRVPMSLRLNSGDEKRAVRLTRSLCG